MCLMLWPNKTVVEDTKGRTYKYDYGVNRFSQVTLL